MKRHDRQFASPQPAPAAGPIRFAINCDADLFLDLFAVCNVHGVTPDVGRAPLPQIKRYAKRQPKTAETEHDRRSKPKRHPASMVVQIADPVPNLTARQEEVIAALRAEYGAKPFKKYGAKAVLMKRGFSANSGHVTKLMDLGALVPTVGIRSRAAQSNGKGRGGRDEAATATS